MNETASSLLATPGGGTRDVIEVLPINTAPQSDFGPQTASANSKRTATGALPAFKQSKMYRKLLAGLMVVCLIVMYVEARYLPTRSQDDRLVRLRQLLKDLLENDFDDMKPEHQVVGYDPRMFKRDAYDRVSYLQH